MIQKFEMNSSKILQLFPFRTERRVDYSNYPNFTASCMNNNDTSLCIAYHKKMMSCNLRRCFVARDAIFVSEKFFKRNATFTNVCKQNAPGYRVDHSYKD